MKTRLSLLLFLSMLASVQISCSQSVKKESDKTSAEVVSETSDLPNMKLTKIDGTTLEARGLAGKSKIILIFFQPDCDHCQNEARQIANRLPAFAGYTLYFISGSSLPEIEKFSRDYKLNDQPNINFAGTDGQSIFDNYGGIPAPSIYLYSVEGDLIEKFNGEMEIDVVIKYL